MDDEAASVRTTTLGDQVRGEARRLGTPWAENADEYARLAVQWFGPRPCKGADLRLVFGEIFRTE
jgi:hypothetical protein